MPPTYLPDGFRLRSVVVNKNAGYSGAEALNPVSQDVVVLTYAKGLDTFAVTTQRSNPTIHNDNAGNKWDDPYSYEGEPDTQEDTVALQSGAFAGLQTKVRVLSPVTPHLWGVDKKLMLMVAGALSKDELIRVANSMEIVDRARNNAAAVRTTLELTTAEQKLVSNSVGYGALRPGYIPDGFRLRSVSYQPLVKEGSCFNPTITQGLVRYVYESEDSKKSLTVSTWKSKPLQRTGFSNEWEPNMALGDLQVFVGCIGLEDCVKSVGNAQRRFII